MIGRSWIVDGREVSPIRVARPAGWKEPHGGTDPFAEAEELEPDNPAAAAGLVDILMWVNPKGYGDWGLDFEAAERRPFGYDALSHVASAVFGCQHIIGPLSLPFDGASDLALCAAFGPERAQAAKWAVQTLCELQYRHEPLEVNDTLAELLVAPIVRHCVKHNAISGQRDVVAMATTILADQWAMPPGMIERAVAAVEQRDAQMAACTF